MITDKVVAFGIHAPALSIAGHFVRKRQAGMDAQPAGEVFMKLQHAGYVEPLSPDAGRRGPRRLVTMPARLSSSAMRPLCVVITNISRSGCRFEARCRFALGTTLLITLPGLTPLAARIIWSEEARGGLQFLQSLSLGVLENLVDRHPVKPLSSYPAPLAEWAS